MTERHYELLSVVVESAQRILGIVRNATYQPDDPSLDDSWWKDRASNSQSEMAI